MLSLWYHMSLLSATEKTNPGEQKNLPGEWDLLFVFADSWSILTEVDKIFPRWYTAKSRKPFCGSKRPQVFRFFTEHRNPLRSKASSLSTRHYTEQSAWRGQPKIRKIAEVFHFTHLGPVTPRAQGHSIVALLIPLSVLKSVMVDVVDVHVRGIVAFLIPSSVLKLQIERGKEAVLRIVALLIPLSVLKLVVRVDVCDDRGEIVALLIPSSV